MRDGRALADELVALLPVGAAGLFNPYTDVCEHDLPGNTPAAKRERLAQHLSCDPDWILVGEAPGYQGCRHTGVAFTSERLLLEGAVPRVSQARGRLTDRHLPFSEPSATIVWKTLYALGIAEHTVMWNALQLHPVGSKGDWSNRTPTDVELQQGAPALRCLAETFPRARLVAVGRKAHVLIVQAGLPEPAAAVRHPANGGATAFRDGLAAVVNKAAP